MANYSIFLEIWIGYALLPVHGCTFKAPSGFKHETNKYTPNGRQLIHNKLSGIKPLIQYLLENKEYDKSVEYNDNRISLMAGQKGKCAITDEPLVIGNMHCHHKKPKKLGGKDSYENLVWVKSEVHFLIHASQEETIVKYTRLLNLDQKALKKVNSLRLLAENLEIVNAA